MMICYAMSPLGAEFLFYVLLLFALVRGSGEGREEAVYITSIAHEPVPAPSMPLLRRSSC